MLEKRRRTRCEILLVPSTVRSSALRKRRSTKHLCFGRDEARIEMSRRNCRNKWSKKNITASEETKHKTIMLRKNRSTSECPPEATKHETFMLRKQRSTTIIRFGRDEAFCDQNEWRRVFRNEWRRASPPNEWRRVFRNEWRRASYFKMSDCAFSKWVTARVTAKWVTAHLANEWRRASHCKMSDGARPTAKCVTARGSCEMSDDARPTAKWVTAHNFFEIQKGRTPLFNTDSAR